MRKRFAVGIDQTWEREEQKRALALEKRERRTEQEAKRKREYEESRAENPFLEGPDFFKLCSDRLPDEPPTHKKVTCPFLLTF